MSLVVTGLLAILGGMTSGGIVAVLKLLFDARRDARTEARRDAAAPLTPRELARLPEIDRLRLRCDALEARLEGLQTQLSDLAGREMSATTLARERLERIAELEAEVAEVRAALATATDAQRNAERQTEDQRRLVASIIIERDGLLADLAALRASRPDGTGKWRTP